MNLRGWEYARPYARPALSAWRGFAKTWISRAAAMNAPGADLARLTPEQTELLRSVGYLQ